MTSSNFSLELRNSERLRFMGLWFCFSDFIERKGKLHLSVMFCQKLQSRKEQEEFTLLMHSVCWKPANFYVFNFPSQGACTGFPKEVLKEPSKVHGDSSARESKSFVNVQMPTSVQYCISPCLMNAKKCISIITELNLAIIPYLSRKKGSTLRTSIVIRMMIALT